MIKSFKNYEEVKEFIGANEFSSYGIYANNELNSHLECNGSDVGSFVLEIENKKYEIFPCSKQVGEDEYEYFYEVEY